MNFNKKHELMISQGYFFQFVKREEVDYQLTQTVHY